MNPQIDWFRYFVTTLVGCLSGSLAVHLSEDYLPLIFDNKILALVFVNVFLAALVFLLFYIHAQHKTVSKDWHRENAK